MSFGLTSLWIVMLDGSSIYWSAYIVTTRMKGHFYAYISYVYVLADFSRKITVIRGVSSIRSMANARYLIRPFRLFLSLMLREEDL